MHIETEKTKLNIFEIVVLKYKSIVILLVFFGVNVAAQKPKTDQYLKNWKLQDYLGNVDSLKTDTVHHNFQENNYIDNYSISNSYNGNLGSPIQSKIYNDRYESEDFLFATPYLPYLQTIHSTRFYNTKTPFSTLKYLSGGSNYRESDNVGFLFSANANKNLNFSAQIDYIYARGEYQNQAAKRFSGTFSGSYQGKKYSATGAISSNQHSNYENGGIQSVDYITNPAYGYEKAEIIPVKISGDAQSTLKYFQLFYTHQYSLGFERKTPTSTDSLKTEFVPVTRFIHTLNFDNIQKRYYENALEKNFYKNSFYTQTRDTAALQRLTNRLAVNLAEEFNKWMRFGLTAYIQNDLERFAYKKDSLLTDSMFTNIKVGGILAKSQGQKFTYNVQAELNFLGYHAGDLLLSANAGSSFRLWKDTISFKARAYSSTKEPEFFLKQYESTHFKWNQSLSKVFKTHIGGSFAIPTKKLSLDVSVENISKMVYFDSTAHPVQNDGSVQLLSATLRKDFRLGKLGLENTIVYQESLNQEVLPLPTLVLFHNLYFSDKWFDVLSLQLGATVRYHTAYYAPGYMPATGQFFNQQKMKIGNYPLVNVYLNAHLKRTRFFAEYYHINQLFMKGVYYSMPDYPINPATLRIGLTWNFYD